MLVVFVDPGESPSDLRHWRDQFGEPDWIVALDTTLAQKVQLRFLDTKFLLDRTGTIRNIDVSIVDDRYLDLVRGAAQQAT